MTELITTNTKKVSIADLDDAHCQRFLIDTVCLCRTLTELIKATNDAAGIDETPEEAALIHKIQDSYIWDCEEACELLHECLKICDQKQIWSGI